MTAGKWIHRGILILMILLNMWVIVGFSTQTGPESVQISRPMAERVHDWLATIGPIRLPSFLQKPTPEPPKEEPTAPPMKEPTTPPIEEPTTPPVEEPTTPPVEEPTTPPVEEPSLQEPTNPERTEEEMQAISQIQHKLRKLAHMFEFGLLGLLILLFSATWKDRYLPLKYLLALAFVFAFAATDELHQTMVADRAGMFHDVLIDLSGAVISCTLALPFLALGLHKHLRKQKEKDTL